MKSGMFVLPDPRNSLVELMFPRPGAGRRAFSVVTFIHPEEARVIFEAAAFRGYGQGKSLGHVLAHGGETFFGDVAVDRNAQILSELVGQGGHGNTQGLGDGFQPQLPAQVAVDIRKGLPSHREQGHVFPDGFSAGELLAQQ